MDLYSSLPLTQPYKSKVASKRACSNTNKDNIFYKIIINYIKDEKTKFLFVLFISLILNLFQVNVISFINSKIVDSLEHKNFKNSHKYIYYLIYAIIIYIILFYVYNYFDSRLLINLKIYIKKQLMKIIFIGNNENLNENNFTIFNTPINRIAYTTYQIATNIFSLLIPKLSIIAIIFAYFFYKNFIFGGIFLIGNILLGLYIYKSINSLLNIAMISEDININNEFTQTEMLNNIEKIISKGQIHEELKIYHKETKNMVDSYNNYFSVMNNSLFIINLLMNALVIILIYYLIYRYKNKNIGIATVITFLTLLLLYRESITNIINFIPLHVDNYIRLETVNKYMNNLSKNYHKLDEINNYKIHSLNFDNIRLENVYFKYEKSNNYILNNKSISINLNDKIIGITGKSGLGKSSLMKIILKLFPYEGDIFIDNININELCPNYIRKNIVYVNQNSKLFDKKVIDNLLYSCNNKNYDYQKYIDEITAYPLIKKLFINIDLNKSAGHGGEKLSGGQRQIINIINGLIHESKIIILDEPTNALDMNLKKEIIKLIKDFKKYKKCIIIISHDKDIFEIFDEKIEL
jgi:ABC-type bacteriocin/lantibiotic exporter with double-glycine peptidase domain